MKILCSGKIDFMINVISRKKVKDVSQKQCSYWMSRACSRDDQRIMVLWLKWRGKGRVGKVNCILGRSSELLQLNSANLILKSGCRITFRIKGSSNKLGRWILILLFAISHSAACRFYNFSSLIQMLRDTLTYLKIDFPVK